MFEPIIASFVVALLSLTGVLIFGARGHLTGTNRFIIPAAIGILLGVVFFELIPETIAVSEYGMFSVLAGFLAFYLLSHLLHTFHHHHDSHCADDDCENKAGASMLLIGDGIHNITDGVVIATAFFINPAVGVATTIGVALHEIPQEIAEYGVLLKAGYSKKRAALYNFLSASSILFGVVLTLLFVGQFENYLWILTGLAAGNLLYIAASDLIPGVQKESKADGRFYLTFATTVVALVAIVSIIEWSHSAFGHDHAHEHDEEQRHSNEHEYEYEIELHHEDTHTEYHHEDDHDH